MPKRNLLLALVLMSALSVSCGKKSENLTGDSSRFSGGSAGSSRGPSGSSKKPSRPSNDPLEDLIIGAAEESNENLSVSDIPSGEVLLMHVSDTALVTSGNRTATATFDHDVIPFGVLDDNSERPTLKDEVPTGMGYTQTLPISLPLKIRAAEGKELTFTSRFYEITLSRYPTDPSGHASYRFHNDATRGYSLFAIFNSKREKKKGATSYYYASIQGVGNVGGFIDRIVTSSGKSIISLHVITMMNSTSSVAKVSLSYIKP